MIPAGVKTRSSEAERPPPVEKFSKIQPEELASAFSEN